MVVRRNTVIIAFFVIKNFKGAVTKNFVGIHVNRRTCAALNWVYWELVMKFTVDKLIRSSYEGIADCLIQTAGCHIGLRRCFFYHSQ
ncbi:hypothetical protein SDC9_134807 [bioreactor metagenome]|uniref:Uncharacterized protein n=1 Tax=bioreactor metagenome TaxID=1076179 RepID=A0A645DEL4_9ZZZZ